MAHAHNRTLIQSLALDLDHKLPLHDAACFYLQERAALLVDRFRPPNKMQQVFHSWPDQTEHRLNEVKTYVVRTVLEEPITKGEGKYRTHVGFLDLAIDIGITEQNLGAEKTDSYIIGRMNLEIKIQRCPTGELVRQINLYKQYYVNGYNEGAIWLVATAYALDEREKTALLNEHIIPIQLDEGYANVKSKPALTETF